MELLLFVAKFMSMDEICKSSSFLSLSLSLTGLGVALVSPGSGKGDVVSYSVDLNPSISPSMPVTPTSPAKTSVGLDLAVSPPMLEEVFPRSFFLSPSLVDISISSIPMFDTSILVGGVKKL